MRNGHLKEIEYTFLKGTMLDVNLRYEGREHLQAVPPAGIRHDAYTSTEKFKKMLDAYKAFVDEAPEKVCRAGSHRLSRHGLP